MTAEVSSALACSSCGAELATPLLCERCGALHEPAGAPTPFAALGLEPAYALDLATVRRRLLSLSRALHPDHHFSADARTRRLAQDNTAALNAAFLVLNDDCRRADWLVSALGGPRESDERAMPPAFLQEVLEWNEAIEEARDATPAARATALASLRTRLAHERTLAVQRVAHALTPLPARATPALHGVRQELNALRYLDRALRELAELELGAPH
ncbi:MAG: hypothetical protein EXS08_14645 [Planctomycetes bacterium]|nr:hypothetical protein [Planctomycetota bacterium]